MQFQLTIDAANAAFGGIDDEGFDTSVHQAGAEVARILRVLADRVEGVAAIEPGDYWPALDVNGNIVGRLEVGE